MIQIEEGKFYRTRLGIKVGPLRRVNCGVYTWCCPDGATVTSAGAYFGADEPHPKDLLAEWVDEPAPAENLHECYAREKAAETSQQEADRLLSEYQAARDGADAMPNISHEQLSFWKNGRDDQQKIEPAWKQDGGKARIDLIAPEFIFGTAEILAFGAAKYAERNWEAGMSWGRCFGALMRHLWAWWGGAGPTRKNFLFGDLDDETGKPHLWHASCCLMFLVAYEERKIGTDDRVSR